MGEKMGHVLDRKKHRIYSKRDIERIEQLRALRSKHYRHTTNKDLRERIEIIEEVLKEHGWLRDE